MERRSAPAALRASYDIITFDPRGFGASTTIQCFPARAAEDALLRHLPPLASYPVTARQTEPCAAWPAAAAQDRYTGPWNRPTAGTILVMGNTGDPITPYQSSVAMSRDLAKARLLTIRGYGHTEFANPSTCATNYEVSYLLTSTLPPVGATCPQNAVPFP